MEGLKREVRVKYISKKKLEEICVKTAELIEEEIERELRRVIELTGIRLDLSEEWPYSLDIEVSITSPYNYRGLKKKLEEALNKAIRRASELFKSEGLEELL